jgi:hypothetical protein
MISCRDIYVELKRGSGGRNGHKEREREREIERKQKMREGERGERRWCCHGTVTETHDKSMTNP